MMGAASRESSQVLCMAIVFLPNAFAQFRQNDEVHNDGCSEQRIFTSVVHGDCILTTHEDRRCVLVHGTLAVTYVRDVLDHNHVVGVFTFLVQYLVRVNHVVHHVGLTDLLGTELLLLVQIFTIIVSKMIPAYNRLRLQTCGHEKVNQHTLDLGLTRLEIVTTDKHSLFGRHGLHGRDEGVLWGPVDVGTSLRDGGHSKDRGRGNFKVAIADSVHKIVGRVVDAGKDVTEPFRVGGP